MLHMVKKRSFTVVPNSKSISAVIAEENSGYRWTDRHRRLAIKYFAFSAVGYATSKRTTEITK